MHPKDELAQRLFSAMAVDESTNVFALSPDSLGFGAFCRPVAGADQALRDKLNVLLNLPYPTGTVVQFVLYASPDVNQALTEFQRVRHGAKTNILRTVSRERVNFLRRSTEKPVDQVSGIRIHDCQLVISVRVPLGHAMPTPHDLSKVRELQQAFLQTLKSSGIGHEPLTAGRYLRFMSTVVNHRPGASWRDHTAPHHEPSQLLCHQILDSDNAVDVDENGLWLGDKARVRLLHVKRYPESIYFGNALRYIGDYMSGSRGIREPVLITFNVLYLDHESKRAKLETDSMWTTKQASGRLARYVPNFARRKESLDTTLRALDDGDRLVRGYLGVAVFTLVEGEGQQALAQAEDRSIQAATNVRTYFRELGFQMLDDAYLCLPLFTQLLPFAAEKALEASLMRYKTYATRHVVPMLPALGAWQGTGSPLLTLFSRDGQMMSVSPWDSGSNYNVAIAAQSGMGKSFLTNDMIVSLLSMGARGWVIDVGGSYKNICKLLDGFYLQFDRDATICLNPFSLVRDFNEEADILAGIVQAMATVKQGLDDFQLQGLKKVLAETFGAHGTQLTIDVVAAALLAEGDPRLQDIGHQLYSFTSAGPYGRYFNGPNTFDADNPFIVCELEELKGRPHLQRVVLMQLIYQIQQRMYLGDRGEKKFLVIDEAWALLAQGDARDFIVGSYRRVRKYGGAAITITQSVNDFWANEGAIAIVENSANWYLLGQKAESINLVQKEQRLPFGEAGYEHLKTVHTVPGEYSEIMCVTERGVGIGRLVVSDFNKLLYSTKPDEVAALKQLESQGLPVTEAVNELLRRRRAASAAHTRAA